MQPIGSKSGNVDRIFGADSTDAATRRQTNLAGRKSVLRMLKFFQTIPGGQKVGIDRMLNETARRAFARAIGSKGETMITVNDYTRGTGL